MTTASSQSMLLTIGHSNHAPEHFQALLEQHQIEVLVDVRSWPHSRYVGWADRANLPELVAAVQTKYLFLGHQLGGRPDDGVFYDEEGYVLYGRVAASGQFREGLERLQRGMKKYRVAVMCSEEDPEHCHRRLLVGKVLLDEGYRVAHIRGDGRWHLEPGPIDPAAGSLFDEGEGQWKSSRSVSRKPPPRTSLAA